MSVQTDFCDCEQQWCTTLTFLICMHVHNFMSKTLFWQSGLSWKMWEILTYLCGIKLWFPCCVFCGTIDPHMYSIVNSTQAILYIHIWKQMFPKKKNHSVSTSECVSNLDYRGGQYNDCFHSPFQQNVRIQESWLSTHLLKRFRNGPC